MAVRMAMILILLLPLVLYHSALVGRVQAIIIKTAMKCVRFHVRLASYALIMLKQYNATNTHTHKGAKRIASGGPRQKILAPEENSN